MSIDLLVTLFLALGVHLLFWAGRRWSADLQRGADATGVVVGIQKRWGGGRCFYLLHYLYAVDGCERQGTAKIALSEREAWAVGDRLPIVYVGHQPEVSRPAWDIEPLGGQLTHAR